MSSMLKMVCSAPYQTFARTFGHFQGKQLILLVICTEFRRFEAFQDSFCRTLKITKNQNNNLVHTSYFCGMTNAPVLSGKKVTYSLKTNLVNDYW